MGNSKVEQWPIYSPNFGNLKYKREATGKGPGSLRTNLNKLQ